jgi:hypothetical protein
MQALAQPATAAAFELHAVGRRVNDPRFDDASCLAPASGAG